MDKNGKQSSSLRSMAATNKTQTNHTGSGPSNPLAPSKPPFIHHGDARELSTRLAPNSVQVTITSPPYFDLKDYGVSNQIGFGQSYEQYLEDLTLVFKNIRNATRDDGSLWIVIDTFRKENEVLPLPFDLTAKLRSAGWVLRDVVIWKKDRTLPWIHAGSTRKIFEYILVLSKSKSKFTYHADKLRDSTELKSWWIRYPERYNPQGKSLEEIWTFDIPTQGSWGKKYIRHFCPLPDGLVSRIIELTTTEGDLVLDPFAGTGTVPSQALRLRRRPLGFELNETYIAKFHSHLKDVEGSTGTVNVGSQKDFSKLILQLRGLKFARTLLKQLRKQSDLPLPVHIVVTQSQTPPTIANKIVRFDYHLLFSELPSKEYQETLAALSGQRPLSKFGVQPSFKILRATPARMKSYTEAGLYGYSETNTHYYKTKVGEGPAASFPILSPIAVRVEDPDA